MALLIFVAGVVIFMALFTIYKSDAKQSKSTDSATICKSESHYSKLTIFEKLGLSPKECSTFRTFLDRFHTYEEVVEAIKKAGLTKSDLILGIDFSASNEWQGRKTFGNRCMHDVTNSKILNPYQKVLSIMGSTMEQFDSDNSIPVFAFGDKLCQNESVFPMGDRNGECRNFMEVMNVYFKYASKVQLGGPTSLAPIIYKAIDIVKTKSSYHILLILSDGQLGSKSEDVQAVIDASKHPLSIVLIGIGDGPWTAVSDLDDKLLLRHFDNFQFVSYQEAVNKSRNPEAALALHVLMEIPDQYAAIQGLGYLGNKEVHASDGLQKCLDNPS